MFISIPTFLIKAYSMPICSFTKLSKHSAYLLWRIDKPEALLARASTADILAEPAYKKLTHPRRRREWLAARLALKELLNALGHNYTKLQKDTWGRPFLANSHMHLSIAHCASFALAAVAQDSPIGVDIQLPCKKLQNVREKFLDEDEVKDGGNDVEKLCIYWCAKEAIYKAHGGKRLSLKDDIRIQGFTKRKQGIVWGEVKTSPFVVHYSFYNHHVLAWSKAACLHSR